MRVWSSTPVISGFCYRPVADHDYFSRKLFASINDFNLLPIEIPRLFSRIENIRPYGNQPDGLTKPDDGLMLNI
jgi:hypothetical protein